MTADRCCLSPPNPPPRLALIIIFIIIIPHFPQHKRRRGDSELRKESNSWHTQTVDLSSGSGDGGDGGGAGGEVMVMTVVVVMVVSGGGGCEWWRWLSRRRSRLAAPKDPLHPTKYLPTTLGSFSKKSSLQSNIFTEEIFHEQTYFLHSNNCERKHTHFQFNLFFFRFLPTRPDRSMCHIPFVNRISTHPLLCDFLEEFTA